jgi:hypothetical protein
MILRIKLLRSVQSYVYYRLDSGLADEIGCGPIVGQAADLGVLTIKTFLTSKWMISEQFTISYASGVRR